jgi:hypothetical protein
MTPIFRVALPLYLAPTLNEYAARKGWQHAKLHRDIDRLINGAVLLLPLEMRGRATLPATKPRHVVVTRRSARQPDELACDIIGGKAVIDRLVRHRMLVDDSPAWLTREARWERCKRCDGTVSVEVLEP